jgi:N-acetylglutamate synthase-like GNAT family acetyltransferase
MNAGRSVPPPLPRLNALPLLAGARGGLATALSRSGLPIGDLDAPGPLFWLFETSDQIPAGFGGLEVEPPHALLRSLVTLPPMRRRGVGRAIVAALEAEATTSGCRDIWLLTTGAREFFDLLGYARCDRAVVPEAIRATREFAALCPEDATVMMKRLR